MWHMFLCFMKTIYTPVVLHIVPNYPPLPLQWQDGVTPQLLSEGDSDTRCLANI